MAGYHGNAKYRKHEKALQDSRLCQYEFNSLGDSSMGHVHYCEITLTLIANQKKGTHPYFFCGLFK